MKISDARAFWVQRFRKLSGPALTVQEINFFCRSDFYEFLSKQFCQENLQFYEMVMEWKKLNINDRTRNERAQIIMENVCRYIFLGYLNLTFFPVCNGGFFMPSIH